jgi:hypothetical protein
MSLAITEPDAQLERMLNAHKKRGKDTVKSMVTSLRKLREARVDLYDFDEFEAFTEDLAINTQAKYCCHVFGYLQAKDKKDPIALLYKKRMNVLQAKVTEAYETNAFTEQQQDKLDKVNWEILVSKRDSLAAEARADPTDQTKMYRHLILCLYTKLPPQRADFGEVKIVSQEQACHFGGGNTYVKTDNEADYIVLRKYKTSASYGRRVLPLPHDLVGIVRDSLRRFPRAYLIAAARDPQSPAGKAEVARRLGTVLKEARLGCNLLRKIVTTEFNSRGEPGAAELTKRMAHRQETSQLCYNNFRVPITAPNSMGVYLG